MEHKDIIAEGWSDYELLDSGDNKKLERFGEVVLVRPETQAIWRPQTPVSWKEAHAEFTHEGGKGAWHVHKDTPEVWDVEYAGARSSLRRTSFKHTGMFPEQSPNWAWIRDRVSALQKPSVLNLFGYTGVASIVAALPGEGLPGEGLPGQGAFVTHVDASKQSVTWAKENATRSGVADDAIRWIVDDALGFARREVRRGTKYQGIILDPPAFGRGAKGEVWKIEEDLPKLLDACKDLLSSDPGAFFLINGYAAGYSSVAFKQLVEGVFGDVSGEYGELLLQEKNGRVLPSGIYARFVR